MFLQSEAMKNLRELKKRILENREIVKRGGVIKEEDYVSITDMFLSILDALEELYNRQIAGF